MHNYSRRELLASGAAVGAAAVAAPALLGGFPASASAATRSLRNHVGHGGPARLDNAEWFEEWEYRMVGLGNRMGGCSGLSSWVDLLQGQLQRLGLSTFRDPLAMPEDRWNATKWALNVVDGLWQTPIRVASYYPYSGVTPASGTTAGIIIAGAGTTAADFAAQCFTGRSHWSAPLTQPRTRPTALGSPLPRARSRPRCNT